METTKKPVQIFVPIATGEEAAKAFLEADKKSLTEMQEFARKVLFWDDENENEKEVDKN